MVTNGGVSVSVMVTTVCSFVMVTKVSISYHMFYPRAEVKLPSTYHMYIHTGLDIADRLLYGQFQGVLVV